MGIKTVILETLGMMGFTFLVGMGVAYIVKILVEVFHFFRVGNVRNVVQSYKMKVASERTQRAEMKKIISLMEEDSDVELLNFYRGIYKDNKGSEDIDDLTKNNDGEV